MVSYVFGVKKTRKATARKEGARMSYSIPLSVPLAPSALFPSAYSSLDIPLYWSLPGSALSSPSAWKFVFAYKKTNEQGKNKV